MNGYSEDLRRKIVSAVERGMSKSQAARTFGVSLSSVKRYVGKADREESLAPKKSPGSPAKLDEKAGRLLAADLEERPFATLQERRDYVEAITGLSVSRSTVCRAIARRIGSTRKKGALGCRARRVLKGGLASDGGLGGRAPEAPLRRRVRGAYLALSDLRLRAQRRAPASVGAAQPGQEHDVLSSMSLEGMGPSLAVEGATTARVFGTYVEKVLVPSLRAGQIVVMDNLGAHRPERIRELIEQRGCELLYLPSYSPDYNPIEEAEEAFAKIKNLLRKAAARSKEALVETIGAALSAVTAADAKGFFEHAGYRSMAQLL